ncbi:MAG: hypothetical protein NT169_01685 [Chloroflexi bacterium]|nr:hypothetical protein [Chloroflexota bacterium]
MKSEATPKIGVLDALTTGLTQAIRRPWLWMIPIVVDLVLWLVPRLAIKDLVQRSIAVWEALVRVTYTSSQLAQMNDLLTAVREAVTQFGGEVNLAEVLTGSWLSAPSAVAMAGSTRLTFISDMVLAPTGLSLTLPRLAAASWQGAVIEVGSWWTVIALLAGGWLGSQLLVTLYFRWAARGWQPRQGQEKQAADPWAGSGGFFRLALRLTVFSLILGVLVFVLRLPLGVAVTMMLFSGGGTASLLFMLVGGMTLWLLLWFLTSFFFVGEAIILDRQPVLKGIWQSLMLVRLNSWPTLGLVLIVNVVLLGFRAVWGLIGRTPVGAIVAITGNAYLVTGMVLGVFTYYDELRRRWQAMMVKNEKRKTNETEGQKPRDG